jgi:hypothetical protein
VKTATSVLLFDVFIVVETLAGKELLQMQEQMKVTWC